MLLFYKTSAEKQNTRLHTLNSDPTTNQSFDTTEVQLCDTVGFIGVTYRNMGEELLLLDPPQHEWQLTNVGN